MKSRFKHLWILLALPLALFIYGRRLAGEGQLRSFFRHIACLRLKIGSRNS